MPKTARTPGDRSGVVMRVRPPRSGKMPGDGGTAVIGVPCLLICKTESFCAVVYKEVRSIDSSTEFESNGVLHRFEIE